MKKGLKYFVIILMVLSIYSANVKAAKVDGYVKFERVGKDRKQVSIYPTK